VQPNPVLITPTGFHWGPPYFVDDSARRTAPAASPLAAPSPREATPPPSNGRLEVVAVDVMAPSNQSRHWTEELAVAVADGLAVRRGQPVSLGLELNRAFDRTTDTINLRFKTGQGESAAKRSHMVVALDGSSPWLAAEWTAEIVGQEDNRLTIQFTPAARALVGKYSLAVHTKVRIDGSAEPARSTFKLASPIYLLFNAWCETDQVYLDGEEKREEYVLLEKGGIWYGNFRQKARRPWVFAQFDETVFKAVMHLLDTKVEDPARGNPVLVSRRMSSAVNSQDGGGVLTGRWDNKYAPHTRPTKWTGSAAILTVKTRFTQALGKLAKVTSEFQHIVSIIVF
jgi:hypothetical protein